MTEGNATVLAAIAELAFARPDPGEETVPAVDTAPAGMGWLDTVSNLLDYVPARVWVSLLGVLMVASIVAFPIARRQAYKAGQRTAGRTSGTDRRDRALFAAAMIPAVGFWFAVLAGSFRGLAAFGRDTLRWGGGWEYLVPFTLDGVAISFGFLAFRAVRKERSPERSNRVVWGSALASASINFFHEVGLPGGSKLGGGYLALLSLFGMLIFHEFLEQFTEGTEWIRREKPKFKERWITWPSNTACAWVAWRNYPPAELAAAATEDEKKAWGSVAHAVAHLEDVRALKRERRRARDLEDAVVPAPWWASLLPWVRVRQLDTAVAEHTAAVAAERVEMAERFARVEAEHTAAVAEMERLAEQLTAAQSARSAEGHKAAVTEREAERARAERDAERDRVARAEQTAERIRADFTEQLRRLESEHAEQIKNMESEHAEQIARIRFEQGERAARSNGRATVTPIRSKRARSSASPVSQDDTALAAMFAEHPERDFNWTDREVNRITGAGFSSRAPRLVGLAMQHLARCSAEQHSACLAAERSTTDTSRRESADDTEERAQERDVIGA